MDRVDDPTNVPAQPAPAATVNPAFFDNGAAGTIITQDWLNGVQEEIASQIESAPYSGTLDKTNDDLLRDSIRFQSGSMLSANIDTGAVTPLYSAAVIASSTSRAQVQNTAVLASNQSTCNGSQSAIISGDGGAVTGVTSSLVSSVTSIVSGSTSALFGRNTELNDNFKVAGGYDAGAPIAPAAANQNLTWTLDHQLGELHSKSVLVGDPQAATFTVDIDGPTGMVFCDHVWLTGAKAITATAQTIRQKDRVNFGMVAFGWSDGVGVGPSLSAVHWNVNAVTQPVAAGRYVVTTDINISNDDTIVVTPRTTGQNDTATALWAGVNSFNVETRRAGALADVAFQFVVMGAAP